MIDSLLINVNVAMNKCAIVLRFCSSRDSFTVELSRAKTRKNFKIRDYEVRFSIVLHMPDELADTTGNNILIPWKHYGRISIKPQVMGISEGLNNYKPHERGCYFHLERQLRFFKSYSEAKCEMECLANFTKSECGCVPYYMPSN